MKGDNMKGINRDEWIRTRKNELMNLRIDEREAFILACLDYGEMMEDNPLIDAEDPGDKLSESIRMAVRGWLLGFQRLAEMARVICGAQLSMWRWIK